MGKYPALGFPERTDIAGTFLLVLNRYGLQECTQTLVEVTNGQAFANVSFEWMLQKIEGIIILATMSQSTHVTFSHVKYS